MSKKKLSLIYEIVKLFKPQIDKWVVKSFIGSGIGLLISGLTGISWYWLIAMGIVDETASKHYGLELGFGTIESVTLIVGFVLIAIGLFIYFLNKYYDRVHGTKPKLLIAILHKSLDDFLTPNFNSICNGRFKNYEVNQISIDQTKLYGNGSLSYPVASLILQKDIIQEIKTLTSTNDRYEIAYFGLAHIPLLFYMGTQLADKFAIEYFEYDRNDTTWICLNEKSEGPEVEVSKQKVDSNSSEAIIKLEISYPISDESVTEIVPIYQSLDNIKLNRTGLDLIWSVEQITHISKVFRLTLDDIVANHSNIERVHIFYAGPPALAINLGRKISKRTDPECIVYNYKRDDKPNYKWGINLFKESTSTDIIIKN